MRASKNQAGEEPLAFVSIPSSAKRACQSQGKSKPSWRELKGERDGRGRAGSQPLAHREASVLKHAQMSGAVSSLLTLASQQYFGCQKCLLLLL